MKIIAEKYLDKINYIMFALMTFKKTHVTGDRNAMWEMVTLIPGRVSVLSESGKVK